GNGLGFSIARQLVELHAGTLDIESNPGLQTTVRVALPLG
ncbi:MAG: ATP-binding protein, partial [Anaerolineales bacterium]|nr:ATP-binding protein [Anaerolineales bacterium]